MTATVFIEAFLEIDRSDFGVGCPDGLYVERTIDRQRGLKQHVDLLAGLDGPARAQMILNLSDAFRDEIDEAIELGDGRL